MLQPGIERHQKKKKKRKELARNLKEKIWERYKNLGIFHPSYKMQIMLEEEDASFTV
jgi:uncharacterized protein (DUF302 family)